ncbi:helix-turn-helix domain-containing protein [Bacillus infantis]|uniref:helix-turn-helix domain-containing protein n=1 Tax=Bacillus infantis TaxID=324767 RepID=UPI0029EDAF64|nr:helix-turn-helix domain-containing protein [Bacillus infantis]
MCERTKAELGAARTRRRKGFCPAADQKLVEPAIKMYNSKEYSISQIVKATGISQVALYRAQEEQGGKTPLLFSIDR